MTGAAPALALLLALAGAAGAAGEPTQIARDQLFFTGSDAEPAATGSASEPVVAALILQRVRTAKGATIEVKGFLCWKGQWRPPFYERLELPEWPGDRLVDAVSAWRRARAKRDLRLDVGESASALSLRVRRPSGGLSLVSPHLLPAGSGLGPHGPLHWRAGHATLEVNGQVVRGVALAERLTAGRRAWPTYGTFEMWVLRPDAGGLLLGRHRLTDRAGGEAISVSTDGVVDHEAFTVTPDGAIVDPGTGFTLPRAWRVSTEPGVVLERIAGSTTRGRSPAGTPAVYDISLARARAGAAAALIFHLHDQPRLGPNQRGPQTNHRRDRGGRGGGLHR